MFKINALVIEEHPTKPESSKVVEVAGETTQVALLMRNFPRFTMWRPSQLRRHLVNIVVLSSPIAESKTHRKTITLSMARMLCKHANFYAYDGGSVDGFQKKCLKL